MNNLSNEQVAALINGRSPPLYHYTREGSLQPLIRSQSLLVTPTCNFPDAEEYVRGLKLILKMLKNTRTKRRLWPELARSMNSLHTAFREPVPMRSLLDLIIDKIQHDIHFCHNPNVKVHVACFTEDERSLRMENEYGSYVIGFSRRLPELAYSVPSPFTSSMLSRVSYDDGEFEAHIPEQGFDSWGKSEIDAAKKLRPLSVTERTEAVSNWITEKLSLFAPNIKRKEYAFEREHRLKASISIYANIPGLPQRMPCSVVEGLPQVAERKEGDRGQYYFKLTDEAGEFLGRQVKTLNTAKNLGLKSWLEDLHEDFQRESSLNSKAASTGI